MSRNFESVSDVISHVESKFNFTIDKFRLSGPDGMRTPFYGLFRSDSCECVGESVRAGYEPHQTEDVLAIVKAAAKVFDGVQDVRCHFAEGHHLVIQPTREARLDIYGSKDSIFPRLIISARYDSRAFRATLGMYRDVCRNLSRIRAVNASSMSISHTAGLRYKMDSLIKTFETLDSTWDSVSTTVKVMEANRVNLAQFLDAIYGTPSTDSQRSATIHKNRTEAIIRRVMVERAATGRPLFDSSMMVSGWEAYNAVQGYVQHEKSRKGGIGMFDRVLMADSDPAVAQAEALALAG